MKFIRNGGIAKTPASEPVYFYIDTDLKLNRSVIYGKKISSTVDTAVYTTNQNTIIDISFTAISDANNDVLTSVVWCERQGLSSLTELHYAEFDEDLKIIRQSTLDSGLEYKEHLLVRNVVIDEMLLVCWIDAIGQNVKLRLFSLDDLQPVSDELELDEYLSFNYFNSSQNITANLTLTVGGDKQVFVQFLLDSGSICTYQVIVSSNNLSATHLFEQGGENVGFHQTLFDAESKILLTGYSENKVNELSGINDIYIISQPVFADVYRKELLSAPQRVNQSSGFYLRPAIIKYQDQYIVSWEGNKLYYTALNSDLNITLPENSLDIQNPARIALSVQGSLFISAQENNWRTIDFGDGLFSSDFAV